MKIDLRQGYQAQRKAAYPPLPDQLDMIYHGLKTGDFAQFIAAIDAVKSQFPKDGN